MTEYAPHQLTVVLANEQQRQRAHRNTFQKWGNALKLSEEQWEILRSELDAGSWAEGNSVVTWVLVPRDNTNGTEHILAHCLTYRRDALIAHPAAASASLTTSYVVGWVYTPPEYRKAGHANHLLSLLHYVLAPKSFLPTFPAELWGAEPRVDGYHDASFSVLYSAIGPSYYSKVRIGRGPASRDGWMPSNVVKRIWDVEQALGSLSPDMMGLEWLDRKGLLGLADAEARHVHLEVADSLSQQTGDTKIAVLPSRGILDYSAFVNQAASPSPDRTYAVRLPAKSIAVDPSFITYLPNNGTLVVTFVVHPVPWTVVLQAARRESCTRVSLWGKAGNDWGHGCHEIVDEASYPSVALYDAGAGVAPVEWVANAKLVAYGTYAVICGDDLSLFLALFFILLWLHSVRKLRHEFLAEVDTNESNFSLATCTPILTLAFAASCLNDVLQGGHSIANDCVRIVVIGESITVLLFLLRMFVPLAGFDSPTLNARITASSHSSVTHDTRWLDTQLRLIEMKNIPGEIEPETFAEQRDHLEHLAEYLTERTTPPPSSKRA